MSQPADPMVVGTEDERVQLEVFLDAHRAHLEQTLDGLTEEEARRRLVPSQTTLLGLVKHLVFVQAVWFTEAVTGTPRTELGLPATADESFLLTDDDTIASVLTDFRAACETARSRDAGRSLDEVVTGHQRFGPVTVRWIHLQVLRELAHHSGHATSCVSRSWPGGSRRPG
ncbi:DinB family protein [Desertihabitans brevis]|uniref:DinB family protein n=1 Tax=Desertihabitans brevis TaxID=2268447 RepID=UPI001F3AC815|nr:DinB family protein [Desertihabitans brevis]